MAEMTASEAIEELKPVWISHWDGPDTLEVCLSVEQGKQIAAIIEQQAQTIDHQNLQIAKLQEDLIKAISGKEASSDV